MNISVTDNFSYTDFQLRPIPIHIYIYIYTHTCIHTHIYRVCIYAGEKKRVGRREKEKHDSSWVINIFSLSYII